MKNWADDNYLTAMLRLDVLMHREILRLRANYELSLDEFRGLYISDQQVDFLLRQHRHDGGMDAEGLTEQANALACRGRDELRKDLYWSKLCSAFQLDECEQDVLFVCFVAELHSKYPTLFAYLNNDVTRKYPTTELVLNLYCDSWENPSGPRSVIRSLLAKGLLQPIEGANTYALQAGLNLPVTARSFLLGEGAIDSSLEQFIICKWPTFTPWVSMPFGRTLTAQFEAVCAIMKCGSRAPVFVVKSVGGQGATELVGNSLATSGYGVIAFDAAAALADRDNCLELVKSVGQAAKLETAGVVVEGLKQLLSPRAELALRHLVTDLSCNNVPLFLLVADESNWRSILGSRPCRVITFPDLDVAQRQDLWRFHLEANQVGLDEETIGEVADYFLLGYEQIQKAVADIRFSLGAESHGQNVSKATVFECTKQQCVVDMASLAEKVDKPFLFKDLVLPDVTLDRIKEIVSAVKTRRLVFDEWDMKRRFGGQSGLVSLFSGSSGTGKTMSAAVIANEIGIDLYRVELSGVVSKYIGETEKNLEKVFAAARKANCILFFDEADALFGKRSEIKDAHDRYANIEVAYLLQQIENYNGLVILTTNLAKNIDQAFSRRVQFMVEFPKPDITLREQLWRGMFAGSAPVADDVDFNFLARQFENSGGDIKNIALDAALLAAGSVEKVVDMGILVRAAARQMVRQGKVPSAVEFKHHFGAVANSRV